LVFVFAEIQDLADRRLGIGRDFDEIETRLHGTRQSLGDGNHTDIVAGSVDELDVRSLYALVDTRSFPIRDKFGRPSCYVSLSSTATTAA
jgi:hypothetical protein